MKMIKKSRSVTLHPPTPVWYYVASASKGGQLARYGAYQALRIQSNRTFAHSLPMSESSTEVAHKEEKFSPALFLVTVALSLAGFLLALKFIAPSAWSAQLAAAPWQWVTAFLVITLFNCFLEFLLHRYVLHKPAIPGLSYFYKQHTHHHNLTRIAIRRTPGGREVPFVENRFPITEPEQGEASFFPWYSLLAFGTVLTPFLIVLHLLIPSLPWFIGGYAALACSISLYEILHAIEHWPFETWARLIENPRWGAVWRKVYSFHLRHHAVIDCNEAISGFFGLPVADWIFGTCILPRSLYTHGGELTAPTEFASPRPVALIRWLDAAADRTVARRRARAVAASHAPAPAAALETANGREYSPGELLAHQLSHGVGLASGIVSLVLLIVLSSLRGNAWHVVSFTVFGLTLLLLFTASLLYHNAKSDRAKRILRRFDRAAIFLLIAGTYTPYLLVSLRGAWGWSLFGAVWGLCAVGASLQLIFGARFRLATVAARALATGLILIAFEPMIAAVPTSGLWLLGIGGTCYLIATLFYAWRKLRYHHAMRRFMIVGGSCCHVLAVLLFLLPTAT